MQNFKIGKQPSLKSKRLMLRPLNKTDSKMVHEYVGDKDVAHGCVNIPHPYPEGMAEAWIVGHPTRFAQQQAAIFGITLKRKLIGSCGLEYKPLDNRFEIGYWIGKPHWGNGYATEAIETLLDYAMNTLGLNEIYAEALVENISSHNVLTKVGLEKIAQVSRPCFPPYIQNDAINIYKIEKPAGGYKKPSEQKKFKGKN